MDQMTQMSALVPVMPEIALAIGAMLMLMAGVFAGERSAPLVNGISVLILAAIGFLVLRVPGVRHVLFNGSFVVDDFARFLKLLTLTGSAGALILSFNYLRVEKQQKFEY